ncbi:hypothetical protein RJT34_16492 [Clitoria ternatea]|uniref:Uncharacterized protein n=1 Tax=Clitoria ternatea TaxID=43366 RepID=A0AAN9J8K0_CLITE
MGKPKGFLMCSATIAKGKQRWCSTTRLGTLHRHRHKQNLRVKNLHGPTNPLLTDDELSTVIAKPNDASAEFLSSSLGRWQNRGSNPNRGLILAFKTIATMSNRLGLVATIKALRMGSSIFIRTPN